MIQPHTVNMKNEHLVGVINIESHITKFSLLSNINGNILFESSQSIDLIKPYPGWVEVDAEKIWNAVCKTINEVINQLQFKGISKDYIKVIGIINERETVLAWNSDTNKPLHNAIHFTDNRTDSIIKEYKSKNQNIFDDIEDTSGLKVIPTFGGTKLKWIVDNTKNIKQLLAMKTIKFGTLDTWLVWKLTNGNSYVTDVTNASRTLLMNLKTLEWSPKACQVFNIPICLLPTIQSSSENYGIIEDTDLKGIMIGSIFANHQAALYGLNYTKPGQIMSRYSDSCMVSGIIGTEFMKSQNGLITTVAYKIGNEPTVYALEGWTLVGGKAIEWLKNNVKIINSDEEIKSLNIDASDVYFIPAFNGLAAPHWKPEAKGIICGMTHFTNKQHIIRAALEALCFHTKDVYIAFEKDTKIISSQLVVDGPYSIYNNLLSYQADILGIDVIRSRMTDMAIYGSAKAAARAKNIEFGNHQWLQHVAKPTTSETERKNRYTKWLKAIRRSCGLSEPPPQSNHKINNHNIISTNILSVAYLLAMIGMMAISDKN